MEDKLELLVQKVVYFIQTGETDLFEVSPFYGVNPRELYKVLLPLYYQKEDYRDWLERVTSLSLANFHYISFTSNETEYGFKLDFAQHVAQEAYTDYVLIRETEAWLTSLSC